MTCSTCNTDARHNDTTGCCAGCGRLFRGLAAFDRHWTTPAPGERSCVDPLTVDKKDGTAAFETVPVKGGVAYRLRTDRDNPWGGGDDARTES